MLEPVNLVDELLGVTRALEAAGIPYAICGGIAVTIHGATRTTKDIDLLVERADRHEAPRGATQDVADIEKLEGFGEE